MRVVIFITLSFFVFSNFSETEQYSTCEIEGIDDMFTRKYVLDAAIKDSYRGNLAVFKTKNIIRMRIGKNSGYLNATWENQTLTISTGDKFDSYELETEFTYYPTIYIYLYFDCIEDGETELRFQQDIIDTNNHVPVFNKKVYEYNFRMTIPSKFDLTEIIPIQVTDFDVTNAGVNFIMGENENFELTDEEVISYDLKKHSVSLVTLKDVVAPFSQEFIITAKDQAVEVSSSTATVIVNVVNALEYFTTTNQTLTNETEHALTFHPPIFGKHLYFADYTSAGELKMNETIVIKYGGLNTTVLKQLGFEKYFKAVFEDNENHQKVLLQKLYPLPDDILKTLDLITIEIEAINEGPIDVPGRTAVLIRLNALESSGTSKDCQNWIIFGRTINYYVPMILLLLAVFSIVFINIYLMIMFVKKQNLKVLF